jgi:hypothetical protein
MANWFRAIPFWRMDPNFTACVADDPALVQAALATPDRRHVLAYFCAPQTGQAISGKKASLALPEGRYVIRFLRPADGKMMETRNYVATGVGRRQFVALPDFVDDFAMVVQRVVER